MKIDTIPINPWQENTYILSDETGECAIIDPGCLSEDEQKYLVSYIDSKGFKPVRLLQTHLHLDHVFGTRFISEKYNLPVEAHRGDEFFIDQTINIAESYGMQLESNPPAIGKYLEDGDKVAFGNSVLEVIHVPGHSPGGIVFYNPEDKIMVAGDVLFRESIGRADLPGGDFDLLINGIKTKLLTLADDVSVYPGHGPSTTIGHEKEKNMFLNQ